MIPMFHGQNRNYLSYDKSYGCMYNSYVGLDARGVAPSGCRVPTLTDFNTLKAFCGGSGGGFAARETGFDHWVSDSGTNTSGWTGLGTGEVGQFNAFWGARARTLFGHWWTTSSTAYGIGELVLNWETSAFYTTGDQNNKDNGGCLRCIVDEATPTVSTITDISGNTYDVITVGTQRWLLQDLKVTKYSNGDPIYHEIYPSNWLGSIGPHYAWYEELVENQ